jgi:glycosyltransferase involved in cell wall biosynthesis
MLKGLDILLHAVAYMLNRRLNVEWWCVGDGPYRPALEVLTRELGISDRVQFKGHVPWGPQLFQLYRRADIFIHPSLTEGVPNALLEAMANSMPIVASAVGGIPGILTHGLNGTLVASGRAAEIAGAVCGLAGDPEGARMMGQAALRKAREHTGESLAESSKRLIELTFGEIATAEAPAHYGSISSLWSSRLVAARSGAVRAPVGAPGWRRDGGERRRDLN